MINYELIESLRKKHRWSYKTLSNKLDCPVDIIKLWESKEMEPTMDDLDKLAKVYDVSLDLLYIKEEVEDEHISGVLIMILIFIGIIIGMFLNNYIYMIILVLLNVILYLCFYNLFKYKNKKEDIPKSLFGFDISEKEKRIYFYEANIIASIYTYLTIIFRFFNIKIFVPDINIIGEKNVNTLLIILASYLLLMFLSFIIELVFGISIKKEFEE